MRYGFVYLIKFCDTIHNNLSIFDYPTFSCSFDIRRSILIFFNHFFRPAFYLPKVLPPHLGGISPTYGNNPLDNGTVIEGQQMKKDGEKEKEKEREESEGEIETEIEIEGGRGNGTGAKIEVIVKEEEIEKEKEKENKKGYTRREEINALKYDDRKMEGRNEVLEKISSILEFESKIAVVIKIEEKESNDVLVSTKKNLADSDQRRVLNSANSINLKNNDKNNNNNSNNSNNNKMNNNSQSLEIKMQEREREERNQYIELISII